MAEIEDYGLSVRGFVDVATVSQHSGLIREDCVGRDTSPASTH